MPRHFVLADESGNLDFKHSVGATRFFILTTVTTQDCEVGASLLKLRRDMAWAREGLSEDFHASENSQRIRDRIFDALGGAEFRADATVFEKKKVPPYHRQRPHYFYGFAWYRHMRRIMPAVAREGDEVLVVSSALGTRTSRRSFHAAVADATSWLLPHVPHRTAHWAASSDPCLYAADYVAWAVQRKWERGDLRSYRLIADKLATEIDEFEHSKDLYY